MKRILIYLLVFSLLLITCGGAVLSEADLTSTSAEELLQAGKFAEANGNYEKALEYYQLAADQEDAEALWFIGSLHRILQEKVMAYLFVLNIELPFCFRYNDCAFNTRMKANSRKAEITYG